MTAIVTSKFRTVNAENFKEDVASNSVYVAIGKPDVWSLTTSDTTDTTPFTPNDHIDDIGEARSQFMAMQKVAATDITHIVPRHTWTTGTTYYAWDSNDGSIFDKAFYVITSEFKVYKCIVAGGSGSTVQPTQTLTAPTAESDGYKWKYMYTLTASEYDAYEQKLKESQNKQEQFEELFGFSMDTFVKEATRGMGITLEKRLEKDPTLLDRISEFLS